MVTGKSVKARRMRERSDRLQKSEACRIGNHRACRAAALRGETDALRCECLCMKGNE